MNNSNQNFTVFHSYEGYSDLESSIKIGDTLKVYYRPTSAAYNRHVYQVEKNKTILESYSSYNKESSIISLIAVVSGLFLVIYGFLKYYNLNLAIILMRLVDPGYGKNSS